MKVIFKVQTSKEERVLFSLFVLIIIVIVWVLNRKYLYIEDCEFENDVCSKLIVRAGFVFKKRIELTPDSKNTITATIPNYNYQIQLIPIVDDKQKPTGQYIMNILRAGNIYKTVQINKDDYYQQYYKSPLGIIK